MVLSLVYGVKMHLKQEMFLRIPSSVVQKSWNCLKWNFSLIQNGTSVDYWAFFRRLFTTNRRFLKLGSFCPEVRPFLPQSQTIFDDNLHYFHSKLSNSALNLGENRRFLKLGSFCPKVRPFKPRSQAKNAPEVKVQMHKNPH